MSVHTSARVWRAARSRGPQLLMLLAIADCSTPEGIAWPSMATLCGPFYLRLANERQGYRLIEALEQSGDLFVQHQGGGRGSNRYFVLCGLDEQAIARTLRKEFDCTPEEVVGIIDRLRATPVADDRGMVEEPPAPTPGTEDRAPLSRMSVDPLHDPSSSIEEDAPLSAQLSLFGRGAPKQPPAPRPLALTTRLKHAYEAAAAEAKCGVNHHEAKDVLARLAGQGRTGLNPPATEEEVAEATWEKARALVAYREQSRTAQGRTDRPVVWLRDVPALVLARRKEAEAAALEPAPVEQATGEGYGYADGEGDFLDGL